MPKNTKGFAPIILILIAVGAAVLVGGGAVLYNLTSNNSNSIKKTDPISHEKFGELKDLTSKVTDKSKSDNSKATAQDHQEYEQKKQEIDQALDNLDAQNPADLSWTDIGSLLSYLELMQRLGQDTDEMNQLMEKLKERAEELLKEEMSKDICNITLDDIKKILEHASIAMGLGSEVDGLMDWLSDALQTLAAGRVDSWPEKWPSEFSKLGIKVNWGTSTDDVLEHIGNVDCASLGASCERMDFAEMAAMFGNEDLMRDIIVGNFEKIKSEQNENCKKGCCQSGGDVTENILKNVCLRTPGAMWQEGKCPTGYTVHMTGQSSGSGEMGPMFGPQTGALQKMLGADIQTNTTLSADLTTCDKSVYSTWKGNTIRRTVVSNKTADSQTTIRKNDLVIPFNEKGEFSGEFELFLTKIGFSAKVNENSMSFTYDFGGVLPSITMQGTVQKGKAVCRPAD